MDSGLVQGTLYSQMASRFQYHAISLGLAFSGDIPLIQIDSRNEPTTVAILPEAWVSNYERR